MRKPTEQIVHIVIDKSVLCADKVKVFNDLDEASEYMNSRADSYEHDCRFHLWDDETEIPYLHLGARNRYLDVGGNILWQVYILSVPVY